MNNNHVKQYKNYMLRVYFSKRINVVSKLDNKEKQALLELEKSIDEKSKGKIKESIRNIINTHQILCNNIKNIDKNLD